MFESNDAMMDEFGKVATDLGYQLLYSYKAFGCNEYFKSKSGIELVFDGEDTIPHFHTPEGEFLFGSYAFDRELKGTFLQWVKGNFEIEVIKEFEIPTDPWKFQTSYFGPIVRLLSRKQK